MSTTELKKELIAFIEKTDDEELLTLLKEDFISYDNMKKHDVVNDLSEQQLQDLKELAEEEDTKDTHTIDDFVKATDQWRIK